MTSTKQRPAVHTAAAESDREQLQALVADLADGFNRKTAAVLDRPFAADAVVVVPDGTIIRGWDALFEYHTARLRDAVADWQTGITVLDTTIVGPDTAILHLEQVMTTGDGDFGNHGTIVAVRRDDQWWIAALHNTNIAT